MFGRFYNCPLAVLGLIFLFALVGCTGGNSSAENGPGPLQAQSIDEDCALCHKSGGIAGVAEIHSPTDKLKIINIAVTGGSTPVTTFTVINETTGSGVTGLTGFSFIIAKLVPGSNGNADAWQSYINALQDVTSPPPGWPPAEGAPYTTGTATQATVEGDKSYSPASKGTLEDLGLTGTGQIGEYRYTFATDLSAATDPQTGTLIGYNSGLTHRIGIETPRGVPYASDSAVLDFVPSGASVTASRNIAVAAACNECHVELAAHGEHRIKVEYCVTCHNPGTIDPHSGNTMDMQAMVHKIHYGSSLPSITDNGGEYAIWGYYNAKHDYSAVVHPQDVRFPGLGQTGNTCTKCHRSGDAADSDNWNTVPTMEACGSCHDTTSFTDPPPAGFTLMPGGAQADNSNCTTCHPSTGGTAGIVDVHTMPQRVAAAAFQYKIISVTDQNDDAQVDPGDLVKVTFSVTDPTNADAPYDILNDPAFTSTSPGASRLAILVGWDHTDFTNTGSGSEAGQPLSIDPLSMGATPAADNGDGTFSVVSPLTIPLDVTGTGVAAIEGHPAGDVDGDGTWSDRIPVKSVFQHFAITGTVEPRRTVVSLDNCNNCHGSLSLHGNNRTDDIQVCTICHNAHATDIAVRPGDPTTTPDGKAEEAIDFKYMIHAIHAGAAEEHGCRENGIVIYGYRGSVNDYSHVGMPSGLNNLKNCSGCHTGSTFEMPLESGVLPTTIMTGYDMSDPDDNTMVTPLSSVCAACHDSIEAKTHMTEEGGQFDYEPYGSTSGGGESALCNPGGTMPTGHSTRTDCCSCHSF